MTAFFDTNVILYAMVEGPRCAAATELLADGGRIGVQSLNEFTAVANRKLGLSFPQISAAIEQLLYLTGDPVPLTYRIHLQGRLLAERYRLGIYDAMLLSAALDAGCDRFYSEEMHHGLVVDRRLTIIDPFRD